MKKQYLIPLFAGAALIAGVSCSEQQRTDTKSTIEFERFQAIQTYRLDGSAKVYGSATDLGFRCSADLLMPLAVEGHDIAALRDSIFSIAFDTTGTDAAAVAYGSLARAAALNSGFQVTDTVLPDSVCEGLYDVEGVVAFLSPKVLSYAVTVSSYAPREAHGMYATYYTNYDVRKGAIVRLSDIFTADGLAQLPSILRQTADGLRGSIGDTSLEALPADGNFSVNGDGDVVFVYQPYEIASYAQGIISIPVPAYLLAEYMTAYGKALLL